jgi:hypothetical protein
MRLPMQVLATHAFLIIFWNEAKQLAQAETAQ